MKEYRIKRVKGSFNWDEIPELELVAYEAEDMQRLKAFAESI